MNSDFREIKLANDHVALVDLDDFDLVNQHRWYVIKGSKTWYAKRRSGNQFIRMHHFILGTRTQVDHKNGNGLDNRRSNLRIANHSQNGFNRSTPLNNTSGFKGVSFHKRKNRWIACIMFMKKLVFLGYFDTPEKAACAYDSAAFKFAGEFAKTNFQKLDANSELCLEGDISYA